MKTEQEIDRNNMKYIQSFIRSLLYFKINTLKYNEIKGIQNSKNLKFCRKALKGKIIEEKEAMLFNSEDLGKKYANEFNDNLIKLAKIKSFISTNNYKINIENFDKIVNSFDRELVCLCNFKAITYLKPYLVKYKPKNTYDTNEYRNIALYKLGNCLLNVYMENSLNIENDFIFHDKELNEIIDTDTDITYIELKEDNVLFYLECK